SMSLPAVFAPFELDGRLLVDGGIVRNLPSQEARNLGADVLICSDVSDPLLQGRDLRSFVDVLMQTVRFQMEASTAEQRQLCDVLITPDLRGLSATAFNQPLPWIARGATAAQRSLAAIKRAVGGDAAAQTSIRRRGIAADSESVALDAVNVEGTRPDGV